MLKNKNAKLYVHSFLGAVCFEHARGDYVHVWRVRRVNDMMILTIHSPHYSYAILCVTYQSEALNDSIKHMEGYLNIFFPTP